MEVSTESQQALTQLLRTLNFALFILTFVLAFRLLPEDLRRNITASLHTNERHSATPSAHSSIKKPKDILPTPPILKASDHTNDRKSHLLIACTGSVATIKLPLILHALSTHPALSIRVILTTAATSFLQGQSAEQPALPSLLNIPNVEAIYLDQDEWLRPWTRSAPILHIELRRWADLMLIAPCSANALAKLAMGESDTLVYSVARAWDATGMIDTARPGVRLPYDQGRRKGIIIAPAMNTAMWEHPVTREHVAKLEGEGWGVEKGGWVEMLRPVEKDLACGDTGSGAMREWKEIVKVVEERLGLESGDVGDEYVDLAKKTTHGEGLGDFK